LSITTTHYRFALGAFLIYDVTNRQSFESIKENWLKKVREFSDPHVQIALVGNKKDLVQKTESNINFKNVIQDTEGAEESKGDENTVR
jgi:GTPase SAR1 family protein